MSKSWRVEGAERKLRSVAQEHKSWKQEALEERRMAGKEDLYSVYVIINEWTPEDGTEDFSEIVESKWYTSESLAWDDLEVIAKTVQVTLGHEDTTFDVPEAHRLGLLHDTYYIQELTR